MFEQSLYKLPVQNKYDLNGFLHTEIAGCSKRACSSGGMHAGESMFLDNLNKLSSSIALQFF